ncbi:MAG TPA: right-handed parallel beta-helix repeat-containing protein, partial [Thermodesulfobacteriota bacterium]|nr:right-handed parallel beta-helix repeat-containing protein [Thermodesulfobacteriota bacterium]
YSGSYRVLPGDYVEEAVITATLSDEHGKSTDWVDALGLVFIDAVAPGPPGGLKTAAGDASVQLRWAKNPDKDIARYKVYRSPTPLTGYEGVGTTETTDFRDEGLKNGSTYFYRVAAVDLAGNEGKASDPAQATAVAPGPTPVKGRITGEITWWAAASPYLIEEDVIVEPGAALTVEPGAVIRSRGEGLRVRGKLTAAGTPQAQIVFERDSGDRGWKGIVFEGTRENGSAVEYARIEGAAAGITCVSSSPRIARNHFTGNDFGLKIRDPFSRPKVVENTFLENETGIEIGDGAAPFLDQNEIRRNRKDGMVVRNSRPILERNVILGNKGAGVRIFSSPAVLRMNALHSNGDYDLFNSPEGEIPVQATDNWWGSREGAKIISRIFGKAEFHRVLTAEYPAGQAVELPILKGPLGGTVSGDSFLLAANSPYVVEKDVIIEGGARIFIEPGVTLKFNPGASFLLRGGWVEARGTRERWITFTSNSSSPAPGSYPAAFRFEGPAQGASLFRYCVFEFAETALEIAHGGPDIDRCLISDNAQAGIKTLESGAPAVSFSTFARNAGTGAVVAFGQSRPKILRSNFEKNAFAVQSHSSIYIDARENWWGESPPSESLFLGEINLKPWLERPEPEAFAGRMP